MRYLVMGLIVLVSLVPAAFAAEEGQDFGINEAPPGGLYLATETAGRVVPAPRLDMDVSIAVNGPMARTRIVQEFVNDSMAYVEGLYLFPLPEKAAVDHLEMQIGNRVIKGQIKEKKQAKAIYEKAKKEGKRATLMVQNRPNMFTNKVANIPPGESIRVVIEYQQVIAPIAGRYELQFPLTLTPRFVPGTPLDDRAPMNTDQVPDGQSLDQVYGQNDNRLRLAVRLQAGFDLAHLDSPSHAISQTISNQGIYDIAVSDADGLMDRAFILRWTPRNGAVPQVSHFVETTEKGDHHLLVVTPPDQRLLGEQQQPGRDITFILDKSGSMGGEPIRKAKAALRRALSVLAPDDRFNIIAFDNNSYALYSRPVAAEQRHLDVAYDFLDDVEADGGTEMVNALDMALAWQGDQQNALHQIVFMTDGAVGNERALLTLIANGIKNSRLFTVGIGSAPNDWFMQQAARMGRGFSIAIAPGDDVGDAMTTLFDRLSRPVLTDLSLVSDSLMDMSPEKPGDLYAGEPLVLTWKSAKDDLSGITLRGQLSGEPWQYDIDPKSGLAAPGIGKIWARHVIGDIETESLIHGWTADERRREILPLALDYALLSDFTAFVAVEETTSRPLAQSLYTRQVKAALPDGMVLPRFSLTAGQEDPADMIDISMRQTATPMQLYMIIAGLLALLSAVMFWWSVRRGYRA